MAGNGFEQMVGLAGAAPAVVDFGFEVLPPGFAAGAGLALFFAPFAVVVAANLEGVAQFVEVLLGGGLLPLVQEVGRGDRYGVEVVVEEAGVGVGLQGQAVAVVVDDSLVAVGFDVGELFELAVGELEALGSEALWRATARSKVLMGSGRGM
jgi:hypothetical protein